MLRLITGSGAGKVDIDSMKLLVATLVIHTVGPQTVIVLPGFVQGLVEYVGFSDQQAGVIASAEMWGMASATLIMMYLFSRVAWRKIFAISLLLMLVGNLASMFASGLYAYCSCRFLVGLGGGAIVAVSYAVFGLTSKADRNFGLGIMFVLVYGAVVFPLMPGLLSAMGMNGVLLFFASLAAIALFFVRYMPDSGEEHQDKDENAVKISDGLGYLALAAMLVYFIANFAVWSYFFRLGVEAGLTEQVVGNGLSVSQFLGIAGAFTAALLGSRYGRIMPLSAGILGAGLVVLIFLGSVNAIVFTVIACVFNYCWNMTHPYLLAAMASFDPSGKMVVYATAMQFIGISVGPALGAALIINNSFDPVILVGAGLFLVSLLLILPPVISQARLRAGQ